MPDVIDRELLAILIDLARLLLWLLILSVIFVPLERLFPLHPQKVFRPAVWADLCYYVVSSLVPGLLLGAPMALVAWAAHRVVPGGYYASMATLPVWLRAALALIVGEVGFYWGHRWSHEVPLLWRFHAIHHSARQLDFLVNTRVHPVDMVFTRLCGLVPMYVLGLVGPVGAAGSLIPLLLILLGTVWGFFIHANLRWRLGPLEWLIATPAFHHWHHTLAAPTDRNYAPMLPWIDRIFGTLHLPSGQWPTGYGIDAPMAGSFAGQLVQPLLPRTPAAGGRVDTRPIAPTDRLSAWDREGRA